MDLYLPLRNLMHFNNLSSPSSIDIIDLKINTGYDEEISHIKYMVCN